MLIRQAFLQAIAAGAVTLAFRRWHSPTVKSGGTLRTAVGVLAIDAVEPVREDDITTADARAAGFESRGALLDELKTRSEGTLYRIRLRLAGADPRAALREQTDADATEVAELRRRLDAMDARSSQGAWTRPVLRALAAAPGCRASELAAQLGLDKERLKTDVRKLKELGLTESLPSGYRLSPRGEALLPRLAEQGSPR